LVAIELFLDIFSLKIKKSSKENVNNEEFSFSRKIQKGYTKLKNNTDTSHGISVFSYGENPTEFFCIVCLVPIQNEKLLIDLRLKGRKERLPHLDL
jgi:hypothetical protein